MTYPVLTTRGRRCSNFWPQGGQRVTRKMRRMPFFLWFVYFILTSKQKCVWVEEHWQMASNLHSILMLVWARPTSSPELRGTCPARGPPWWTAFLSPSPLTSRPWWRCCAIRAPSTPCWGAVWRRQRQNVIQNHHLYFPLFQTSENLLLSHKFR